MFVLLAGATWAGIVAAYLGAFTGNGRGGTCLLRFTSLIPGSIGNGVHFLVLELHATLEFFSLTAQPGDYAAFAPKVIAAAEAGDRHAQALMQEGAAYYLRALKALDFAPGDPLCLLGGIGPHYARYLPEDHLSGLIAARGTALDGAFHLVCKAAAEEVLP